MQDTAPRLRPMGLADLLDASFALYRRNFALFAGIAAVLGVPEAILNAVLSALSADSSSTVSLSSTSTRGPGAGFYFGTGGGGLIGLIFGTLIDGALAYAISRRYLGEPVVVEGAYVGVGRRGFLRLFGAVFLGILLATVVVIIPVVVLLVGALSGAGALVFLGVIAVIAIVPVLIFLFVHLLFSAQAVVIEGLGPADALRRSWDLVRGSGWRVLGIAIVVTLIVSIISGIISGILTGVLAAGGSDRGVRFIASLIASLVGLLIQPFQLIAFTLLYFDLRIRKEGFDLEQMVRRMDPSDHP